VGQACKVFVILAPTEALNEILEDAYIVGHESFLTLGEIGKGPLHSVGRLFENALTRVV